MVMLQRRSVYWKENGHSTEVASLMEGEWSCYRCGKFNSHGHVTEVEILIMENSRYKGGQFNGGKMVMLLRWPV